MKNAALNNNKLIIGEQRPYMTLNRKAASLMFRARTNLLDPIPRKPYWDNVWRCKLCLSKKQNTKHYITECRGTKHIFTSDRDRELTFQTIKTLETDQEGMKIEYRKIKLVNNLLEIK